MADAYTLPSDLFIPEAVREYLGYEFYSSLGVLDNLASTGPLGSEAPIQIRGLDILQNGGEYIDKPTFAEVASLATKRDYANGGNAVDTLKLTSRNDSGVAMRVKIGPLAITNDAGIVSRATGEQLAMEFARQAARRYREYIQTAVVLAAKAAITNMTTSLHTLDVWNATTRTNMSTGLIARGRQKMGDRVQSINGILVRSEAEYDLFIEQDGKGVSLQLAGTGTPLTLNLAPAVVDEAALTTTDAGFDKYHTLLMGAGFCEVSLGPIRFYPPEQRLDTESVHSIWRADGDFSICFPGIQYDEANGGANPANTAGGVGLSTNWDPVYTNAREVKGVLVTHNYTEN